MEPGCGPIRECAFSNYSIPKGVKQFFRPVFSEDRKGALSTSVKLYYALDRPQFVIFCNSVSRCEWTVKRLADRFQLNASAIFDFTPQQERDETVKVFLRGFIDVLVCTGDWPEELPSNDVTLIVNLDFPQDSEGYAKRIGNTERQALLLNFAPMQTRYLTKEFPPSIAKMRHECSTTIVHLPDTRDEIINQLYFS